MRGKLIVGAVKGSWRFTRWFFRRSAKSQEWPVKRAQRGRTHTGLSFDEALDRWIQAAVRELSEERGVQHQVERVAEPWVSVTFTLFDPSTGAVTRELPIYWVERSTGDVWLTHNARSHYVVSNVFGEIR